MNNLTLLACLSAALSVIFSTFIIIDFITDTSKRYRARFIQETSVEYEDILLSMPPGRIFDLSLALSALGAFLGAGVVIIFCSAPGAGHFVVVCLAAAAGCFPLPRVYLRFVKKRRLEKFNEQLEDALLSISGSLKAGFSIIQALELVADEKRSPISYEFTILLQELRLGVQFETALENASNRIGSQDFELVTVAINTARQTGGELTGVLERLAGVIRERVRIQRKLASMTAQGRLQAYLIGAMPFLLMFAMANIAPVMMDAFFSSMLGILAIAAAVVLVFLGFLMIRKITTIDI